MTAPFPTRRHALGALAGAALAAAHATLPAWAQAPLHADGKPVTLVVPYAAGGGTDIVGRLMAQKLGELWGQTVIVDNRTGANGVIGSSYVAKAAPDGHTLLLVVGSHAINPVLMKSVPYDTAKAFTPITNIASSPMVLVVAARGPYKALPDLLQAARKDDIPVGYSEGQTRLTGELIRQAGGLKITGVPYKGGAPLMVDIIGGHLPAGFTSVLTALPHVQAGNLRVLGVVADQRMALFPDAMTFQEAGLQGVESLNWYGLFGPAHLPAETVAKIREGLQTVTRDPGVAKQMQDQGARLVLDTPEAFQGFLARETGKWTQVAKRGGIQAE
ncbi:tripartite tricarboxylate transporter substrate binding protein [Xylophilus sp. Leaf220]|uniref:tripartite tricarboxylate transporter substrate binding protein n=1 Tax=Xylophilus sp. Leaf220 TaxID=1735686 RepID=UPI0006F214DD|nr:tripartite tricarboxylate transporter substrate binding protein [Xylophilus sp. Leaf220]KQM68990.1 hypothetical protein ASE76_12090 [Xylophilus sp. Leaf220]